MDGRDMPMGLGGDSVGDPPKSGTRTHGLEASGFLLLVLRPHHGLRVLGSGIVLGIGAGEGGQRGRGDLGTGGVRGRWHWGQRDTGTGDTGTRGLGIVGHGDTGTWNHRDMRTGGTSATWGLVKLGALGRALRTPVPAAAQPRVSRGGGHTRSAGTRRHPRSPPVPPVSPNPLPHAPATPRSPPVPGVAAPRPLQGPAGGGCEAAAPSRPWSTEAGAAPGGKGGRCPAPGPTPVPPGRGCLGTPGDPPRGAGSSQPTPPPRPPA